MYVADCYPWYVYVKSLWEKKKKKNGEEQSGAEWGSTLHCRTPAIAQTEAIQKASDYRVWKWKIFVFIQLRFDWREFWRTASKWAHFDIRLVVHSPKTNIPWRVCRAHRFKVPHLQILDLHLLVQTSPPSVQRGLLAAACLVVWEWTVLWQPELRPCQALGVPLSTRMSHKGCALGHALFKKGSAHLLRPAHILTVFLHYTAAVFRGVTFLGHGRNKP